MNMKTSLMLLVAAMLASACGGGTQPTISFDTAPEVAPADTVDQDGAPQDTARGVDTPKTDGPCLPECDDKECGPDGCGGTCGACDDGWNCVEGTCEEAADCVLLDECLPLICGPDGKCAPCEEDADCEPALLYCDPISGQCSECVIDDHCLDDEACQDNQCVPGLCPEAPCPDGKLCDETNGQCVDCLTTEDCPEFHDCVGGECVEFTPCMSSKDCALDEVCDKLTGKCVECIENADCPDGFKCLPTQVCEEILFCDSDKDCKDYDKVCDKDIGECVDCLIDADCQDDAFCFQKTCQPDVCDQSAEWPQCQDGAVVACSENGSVLTVVLTCGPQQFCEDGECKNWVCPPDSSGCLGSIAYECNSLGSGFTSEVDCTDDELTCVSGGCIEVECEPNLVACATDLALVYCDVEGVSFEIVDCPVGKYCDPDTVKCQPWLCTPGEAGCDGYWVSTCNEYGSGWIHEENCGDEGMTCENAECLECTPSCEGLTCGDDGCGGSCGECECGETCAAGNCVFTACIGKDCGDDGCGGTCGECGCGETCAASLCIFTACTGKECGPDGCGGNCGWCGPNKTCTEGICI